VSLAGIEEVPARHGTRSEEPRQVCQGFALAKSLTPGGRVYAPHVQVFAGDSARPTDGYGGGERCAAEIFDLAVIDEDRPAVLEESVALRDIARRARYPALQRPAAAARCSSPVTARIPRSSAMGRRHPRRSWT
jgi:hypothetical protein